MQGAVIMERLGMWIEALATCAIEGNQWAQETLRLRETGKQEDRVEFLRRLVMLESGKEEAKHEPAE